MGVAGRLNPNNACGSRSCSFFVKGFHRILRCNNLPPPSDIRINLRCYRCNAETCSLFLVSNDMKRCWQAGDSTFDSETLSCQRSHISVTSFADNSRLHLLLRAPPVTRSICTTRRLRIVTGKMHLVDFIYEVGHVERHVLEHAPRAGINNLWQKQNDSRGSDKIHFGELNCMLMLWHHDYSKLLSASHTPPKCYAMLCATGLIHWINPFHLNRGLLVGTRYWQNKTSIPNFEFTRNFFFAMDYFPFMQLLKVFIRRFGQVKFVNLFIWYFDSSRIWMLCLYIICVLLLFCQVLRIQLINLDIFNSLLFVFRRFYS